MKPIWHDIRPADIATLANVAMGVFAITLALRGETAWAFHLIFLSVIVDGIDGAVARLGGGGGPLGEVIDTLADVVTFVAAPVVVLLAHEGSGHAMKAAALAFAFAGVLRLARFQTRPAAHFFGLSTPGGAIVLGSAALLGVPAAWAWAPAVAAGVLMLSRWPVPKLRGAIGAAGVVVIVGNFLLFTEGLGRYGLIAQLAFTAVYLVAGPAYLKAQARVGPS